MRRGRRLRALFPDRAEDVDTEHGRRNNDERPKEDRSQAVGAGSGEQTSERQYLPLSRPRREKATDREAEQVWLARTAGTSAERQYGERREGNEPAEEEVNGQQPGHGYPCHDDIEDVRGREHRTENGPETDDR